MKKIIGIFVALIFVLGINLALAHGNFNETKKLIDSEISCKELSDEQLEEIGDYYMEQMHPGESHELMDGMMGNYGYGLGYWSFINILYIILLIGLIILVYLWIAKLLKNTKNKKG